MSRSPDEIRQTARMARRPTSVDDQITRIWREILGAEDVGLESDFAFYSDPAR